MRAYLSFLIFSILFFSGSCKKDSGCTPVSPAAEDPQIMEYNITNGIGAQKLNNTIYYKIIDSGYGIRPAQSSKVTVTYTGKLVDNTVFDNSPVPATYALMNVIEGWQLGLPLIRKGGKIILIIPSAYAYGCNGNKKLNVPSDAVLVYNIDLLDVVP